MSFNPANTKWSVAEFDDNGKIGDFHPTPWEFHNQSMNAGQLWYGGYQFTTGSDNTITCEIGSGNTPVNDTFQVVFVTSTRFVATKHKALYRFGKLL